MVDLGLPQYSFLPLGAAPPYFLLCPPLVFLPALPALSPFRESSLPPCPEGQIEDALNNLPQTASVNRKLLQKEEGEPSKGLGPWKGGEAQRRLCAKGDNIQLKNRNILPNTVNVILSYVRRANRSRKAVQGLVRRLGVAHVEETVRQFYAYQNFLKNNATDFITRQAIQALMDHQNPHCSFFSLPEQALHNRLFRLLVRHYLRHHYLPALLSSSKLTPPKRRDHLAVLRYLQAVLAARTHPRPRADAQADSD